MLKRETCVIISAWNQAGLRPHPGSLCLVKTDYGYIPAGVVLTDSYLGMCHLVHFYRTIITNPKDTSYFPLVESNDLLIPPMDIPRQAFDASGFLVVNNLEDAPVARVLDHYYFYANGDKWNVDERAFVPMDKPDATGTQSPIPLKQRLIYEKLPGEDRSIGVHEIPAGAWVSPSRTANLAMLEEALGESLRYYGLLRGAASPQLGISSSPYERAAQAKAIDTASRVHLVSTGGVTALYFEAPGPESVAQIIRNAGFVGNGYFWHSLIKFYADQRGFSDKVIFDPEAGMFSVIGTYEILDHLREVIESWFNNPQKLPDIINNAQDSDVDFDD